MQQLLDVAAAAHLLGVDPSRVRALIAEGALRADKLGGRWLVHHDSVVARRNAPAPPGRPMTSRNAWLLLLDASGDPIPDGMDPMARWRQRQALRYQGLLGLRGRLSRRAEVHRLWALPGELRALLKDKALVLTGSSAAGALRLGLAAPDTVDAYVAAERLDGLRSAYGLEEAAASQANVILRAVPHDGWFLHGRRVAPQAAVALDLASYSDSRSSRVGMEMLERLNHGFQETG